jgi:alkylhydroperoxidase family enzyme
MVIELVADDRPHLAPDEEAAVNFALKFASDHTAITEQEKKELQTHFTPEQIIELGLLCVMCMVGRFSMLAGIEAASCAV